MTRLIHLNHQTAPHIATLIAQNKSGGHHLFTSLPLAEQNKRTAYELEQLWRRINPAHTLRYEIPAHHNAA